MRSWAVAYVPVYVLSRLCAVCVVRVGMSPLGAAGRLAVGVSLLCRCDQKWFHRLLRAQATVAGRQIVRADALRIACVQPACRAHMCQIVPEGALWSRCAYNLLLRCVVERPAA